MEVGSETTLGLHGTSLGIAAFDVQPQAAVPSDVQAMLKQTPPHFISMQGASWGETWAIVVQSLGSSFEHAPDASAQPVFAQHVATALAHWVAAHRPHAEVSASKGHVALK
jgi:hypothetical protein